MGDLFGIIFTIVVLVGFIGVVVELCKFGNDKKSKTNITINFFTKKEDDNT